MDQNLDSNFCIRFVEGTVTANGVPATRENGLRESAVVSRQRSDTRCLPPKGEYSGWPPVRRDQGTSASINDHGGGHGQQHQHQQLPASTGTIGTTRRSNSEYQSFQDLTSMSSGGLRDPLLPKGPRSRQSSVDSSRQSSVDHQPPRRSLLSRLFCCFTQPTKPVEEESPYPSPRGYLRGHHSGQRV